MLTVTLGLVRNVAFAGAQLRCMGWFYQPKMPKELFMK